MESGTGRLYWLLLYAIIPIGLSRILENRGPLCTYSGQYLYDQLVLDGTGVWWYDDRIEYGPLLDFALFEQVVYQPDLGFNVIPHDSCQSFNQMSVVLEKEWRACACLQNPQSVFYPPFILYLKNTWDWGYVLGRPENGWVYSWRLYRYVFAVIDIRHEEPCECSDPWHTKKYFLTTHPDEKERQLPLTKCISGMYFNRAKKLEMPCQHNHKTILVVRGRATYFKHFTDLAHTSLEPPIYIIALHDDTHTKITQLAPAMRLARELSVLTNGSVVINFLSRYEPVICYWHNIRCIGIGNAGRYCRDMIEAADVYWQLVHGVPAVDNGHINKTIYLPDAEHVALSKDCRYGLCIRIATDKNINLLHWLTDTLKSPATAVLDRVTCPHANNYTLYVSPVSVDMTAWKTRTTWVETGKYTDKARCCTRNRLDSWRDCEKKQISCKHKHVGSVTRITKHNCFNPPKGGTKLITERGFRYYITKSTSEFRRERISRFDILR
ncbi:protein TE29 [Testudinid alphaherpesvirus 3]|uniref:Protein TE29 n=1 Tax=Testudinid alphaherpesvirus 3 TaxID=2560801 RepID=A0A0M3MZ76_9ALPH|nr:protein TE29 [Testudinid alphaherpesvirus 3]AKI81686.1 protein TE29 [Testudinid alphaherpesvirus 3]AKI81789.1 protein TE29 [Testudinid alphaherpesvirus 3]